MGIHLSFREVRVDVVGHFYCLHDPPTHCLCTGRVERSHHAPQKIHAVRTLPPQLLSFPKVPFHGSRRTQLLVLESMHYHPFGRVTGHRLLLRKWVEKSSSPFVLCNGLQSPHFEMSATLLAVINTNRKVNLKVTNFKDTNSIGSRGAASRTLNTRGRSHSGTNVFLCGLERKIPFKEHTTCLSSPTFTSSTSGRTSASIERYTINVLYCKPLSDKN